MQSADFVMEAQQQIVRDREQRAFQRGEKRQFVLRPFDGGERGAQGFHFFAVVKRFRTHQKMRDLAGFQRPDVIARDVAADSW